MSLTIVWAAALGDETRLYAARPVLSQSPPDERGRDAPAAPAAAAVLSAPSAAAGSASTATATGLLRQVDVGRGIAVHDGKLTLHQLPLDLRADVQQHHRARHRDHGHLGAVQELQRS